MSTTTIRLSKDLKSRIARAAERAGTTSHALMLDAIAQRVIEEEHRNEFYDCAEQRFEEIAASGLTIPWSEMRTYLEKQIAGTRTARPTARKLTR